MIPYGRQDISAQDIQAVVDVLQSDYLTQGPAIPAFESAVASYVQVKHAIAVNSATSALHLACLTLEVGPGDLVWTSPISFVASANCALYCGADVDFVDIDPASYNMSMPQLAEKLAGAEANGRLPKVVIPVHLCGQSCDMQSLAELAQRYGFKVIEDASHAIGGKYRGDAIGNCRYSDIAIFSFHPVKIITTGEGGMALTNNPDLAMRMQLLRSHGVTRDPQHMTEVPHGPWYYQQIALGFNYRMTDIQAALGLSQMSRLDEFVAKRHQLAERYDTALASLPLTTPWQDDGGYSAIHLYVIRLKTVQVKRNHREIFEALRADGIGVNLHYMPIYLQPYYANLGFSPGICIEAERYYSEAISLPMHVNLSDAQQHAVIESLKKVLLQ